MIVSIASGKGGTGKTMVAVSFALSLIGVVPKEIQLLDCDVEEPNARLFIQSLDAQKKTVTVPVPVIDASLCNLCGRCAEVCVYNAIAVTQKKALVFPELCKSCGACSYLCPQKAITEKEKKVGSVEEAKGSGIALVSGKLEIGEIDAVSVIKAVKKRVDPQKINVIDSPPGTSCPVLETLQESDFCILVTEPTPFGLNDLKLAVETLRKLQIPFGVIINRCDLGSDCVEAYCEQESISVLLKIPFKREIANAYSRGIPFVEVAPEYRKRFQTVFQNIVKELP